MATFVRDGGVDRYRLITAGAESNVAVAMAVLGCRTQWRSRLGADELGAFVADSIAAAGVDVVTDLDAVRPTGAAVKEVGPSGSRMRYYRAGSAASRLDLLDTRSLQAARRLHLTGVTPALSPENREVVARVLAGRPNLPTASMSSTSRARGTHSRPATSPQRYGAGLRVPDFGSGTCWRRVWSECSVTPSRASTGENWSRSRPTSGSPFPT